MDLKLDTTHDLMFVDGDFVLTSTISESLAQRLKVALLTFYGEWFLDVEEGLPYYEQILGRNRAKQTIDLIFKNKILSDPDVESVVEFESTLDSARVYELKFTVKTTEGDETVPVVLSL